MSASHSEVEDESRPFPPRFHWLKRLSFHGLLALVALTGLRLWWGHEAQRRIDALIQTAHARGEPILLEDFAPRDIADADNAAILYKRANQSLRFTQPEVDFWPSEPISPADLRFIAGMISAHSAELQLMRQARGRHDVEWGDRITRPLLSFQYRSRLRNGRYLVELLKYASAYEHARQEDGSAIERVRDGLAFGNACAKSPTGRVDLLLAQGFELITVENLISITPTLGVSTVTKKSAEDATPAQIQALIAELLDETCFQQSAVRAWMGSRMYTLAAEPEYVRAEVQSHILADLLWPMFQLQAYRTAVLHGATALAIRQENYPAARAMLPPNENDSGSSLIELLVRNGLMGSSARVRIVEGTVYKLSAHRRLAATMLAIRLYEADHGGRLPRTLSDLSPTYLPAVPLDPFASGRQPLRYLPDRDPPVLYSLGFNETDEGGSTRPLRRHSTSAWDAEDAVFPLRPSSATTLPTE